MGNFVTVYVPPVLAQRRLAPLPGWQELDSYHRYVAPKLSGYFDSPFWSTLIPQMAHSEPAIRHAVIAISTVHRDLESLPFRSPTGSIEPSPAALKETSEAMRSLTTRMATDPSSSLVPLVACLLFTCLDFLRGSSDTAMMHMKNGFQILNTLVDPPAGAHPQQVSDSKSIREHIVPVFTRLNLLCILFGQALPFRAFGEGSTEISTFTSLEDGRIRLYELINTVIRFIRAGRAKSNKGEIEVSDLIEKIRHERQMERWYSCLMQFVSATEASDKLVDAAAINIMKLHYRTIYVFLSVCLSLDESATDLHTPDFEEIINLGELIVSTPSSPGQSRSSSEQRSFSFEMGIIPSLYFTTIKCRNPALRRRSLTVLRKAPLREGLWMSHIAAKVAERLIQVEESGLRSCDLIPLGLSVPFCSEDDSEDLRFRSVDMLTSKLGDGLRPLHEVCLPPEAMRVHSVTDPPMDFQTVHKVLTTAKTGQSPTSDTSSLEEVTLERVVVTFRAKPWGLSNDWHVWKDYVPL